MGRRKLGAVMVVASLAMASFSPLTSSAQAGESPTGGTLQVRDAASPANWTWPYRVPPVGPGLPLGSVKLLGPARGCPEGSSGCQAFSVRCPGVSSHAFEVSELPAVGQRKGMMILYTGGPGTEWWSARTAFTPGAVEDMRNMGFIVVQVRWTKGVTVNNPTGAPGIPAVFCRPATVTRFLHDYLYVPLGIAPSPPGTCGFCLGGNSGGANQIAYGLSHYGLDGIIDVIFPSGGPPYAALTKTCLGWPRAYSIPAVHQAGIDLLYGFADSTGPCMRRDASFSGRWDADAVATGGNDYFHPTTRIAYLTGARDPAMLAIGRDWYDRMAAAGTPMMSWETVPDGLHVIWSTRAGTDQWLDLVERHVSASA